MGRAWNDQLPFKFKSKLIPAMIIRVIGNDDNNNNDDDENNVNNNNNNMMMMMIPKLGQNVYFYISISNTMQ